MESAAVFQVPLPRFIARKAAPRENAIYTEGDAGVRGGGKRGKEGDAGMEVGRGRRGGEGRRVCQIPKREARRRRKTHYHDS